MPECGPMSFRDARTDIRTNSQRRLGQVGRLFHLSWVCAACFLHSSCSNSSQTTQAGPAGPAVQVVETTGDRSVLLQAQSSVSFGTGGSSSGLVVTVDAATQYQQMDGLGASLTDSSAWL